MKRSIARITTELLLLTLMGATMIACSTAAMKGTWQEGETHSPAAKHLIGKWKSIGAPFALTLEPRTDTNGSIMFHYQDHSIVDDNCLLSAYPIRPTYETESVSLRFFSEQIAAQPALEITGTVSGDSIHAEIAFKYDKDIATEVWHATLQRQK